MPLKTNACVRKQLLLATKKGVRLVNRQGPEKSGVRAANVTKDRQTSLRNHEQEIAQ